MGVKIWFTADAHFGHENIIKLCKRPFGSVEEMDEALIANWNETVGPDDYVYHLGDLTLGGPDVAAHYLKQLNGRIQVMPGSHDQRWLEQKQGITNLKYVARLHVVVEVPPLVSLSFMDYSPDGHWPQVVVLCHYALRVWDRSHYGSWHLYGHSHGRLPGQGLSMDVGVDVNDYRPVSLEKVAAVMRGRAEGLQKEAVEGVAV